jgi:hypothetical protein
MVHFPTLRRSLYRHTPDTDRYRLVHRVKTYRYFVNISAGSLTSNIINISLSDQYKDTTEHMTIYVFRLWLLIKFMEWNQKRGHSSNCAATYNCVNCHYFMALSHIIKVFYLKNKKNLNPLYFGLSHMSVSSDRQLRNAGLRSPLSLFFIHWLPTLKRRAA